MLPFYHIFDAFVKMLNTFSCLYNRRRNSKGKIYSRSKQRRKREFFPLNAENVKNLWRSFADLGIFEASAIDTTNQTVDYFIMALMILGSFSINWNSLFAVPVG